MTKEEVLNGCTIDGNVVKLPDVQLDRKVYQEVAKALNLIGGSWKGGKIAGFVFKENPSEYLQQIQGGETRNLKKEFQFFPTPNDIADWLVELAGLDHTHSILEPSAGQGAIMKSIRKEVPHSRIHYCELMPLNRTFLNKIDNIVHVCDDFMEIDKDMEFNRIIANPPFTKNQDIDHIMKMNEVLKKGGRIVSVASKHWQLSSNKKEVAFRKFVESNGEVHDIEAGRFKSSGTMIASCVIVIG